MFRWMMVLGVVGTLVGGGAYGNVKKKGRVLVIYDRMDTGDATKKCKSTVATGIAFTAAAEKAKSDLGAKILDTGPIDGFNAFSKFVDKVSEVCEGGLSPFDDIRIYDHGCEGNQTVGDYFMGKHTIERAPEVIAKLAACVGNQGMFSFYGCSVGGGDAGSEFVQAMADSIQHAKQVNASSACSTWGNDGNIGIKFDVVKTPRKDHAPKEKKVSYQPSDESYVSTAVGTH